MDTSEPEPTSKGRANWRLPANCTPAAKPINMKGFLPSMGRSVMWRCSMIWPRLVEEVSSSGDSAVTVTRSESSPI